MKNIKIVEKLLISILAILMLFNFILIFIFIIFLL